MCCQPDLLRNRRGVALYRTYLESRSNTAGILMFAACTFRCIVQVDGKAARLTASGSVFFVRVQSNQFCLRLVFLVGVLFPQHPEMSQRCP